MKYLDKLTTELNKFNHWAKAYPQKQHNYEWELNYNDWQQLRSAFFKYIHNVKLDEFCQANIDDIIYLIARDNEMEEFITEIGKNRELFQLILSKTFESNEADAKWQFAVELSNCVIGHKETEKALLRLVVDKDEYTSRRALQSLGIIKSPHTEKLCIKAWASNHEYQRIMVLWVLKDLNSSHLQSYLKKAKEDGRKYLVQNAIEIKNNVS